MMEIDFKNYHAQMHSGRLGSKVFYGFIENDFKK